MYAYTVKVRDVIRQLEKDGWHLHSQRGSHWQFTHPSKTGRVTVPDKIGDDLAIGTLKSIYRQAQFPGEGETQRECAIQS